MIEVIPCKATFIHMYNSLYTYIYIAIQSINQSKFI